MRWRVLIVRPSSEDIAAIISTVSRAGIDAVFERVATRPALLAAVARQEWELVVYDPSAHNEVPVDLVYTHAPAAAVVLVGEPEDMADEIGRVVAARLDVS